MKIIQTVKYLKKQAQFNRVPVPQRHGPSRIPSSDDAPEIDKQNVLNNPKQSGDYEVKINWEKETEDLINSGYDVRGLPQRGINDIRIYYQFDVEKQENDITISNIRLLDIKILMGGKYQALVVSEPATKEGIFEGLKEEIVRQEEINVRDNYHPDDIGV